jgi:hypothetical protein
MFSFPFGEIGEILAIHFYKDQMANFLKTGQGETGGWARSRENGIGATLRGWVEGCHRGCRG